MGNKIPSIVHRPNSRKLVGTVPTGSYHDANLQSEFVRTKSHQSFSKKISEDEFEEDAAGHFGKHMNYAKSAFYDDNIGLGRKCLYFDEMTVYFSSFLSFFFDRLELSLKCLSVNKRVSTSLFLLCIQSI